MRQTPNITIGGTPLEKCKPLFFNLKSLLDLIDEIPWVAFILDVQYKRDILCLGIFWEIIYE